MDISLWIYISNYIYVYINKTIRYPSMKILNLKTLTLERCSVRELCMTAGGNSP